MISIQKIIRNLLTTSLVVFLICLSTLAPGNGLLSIVNLSNLMVEDVVDEVVSQSVQAQRAVQYQKQRSETPSIDKIRTDISLQPLDFKPCYPQLESVDIEHSIIRGPPLAA